jgi:hypothetical protein
MATWKKVIVSGSGANLATLQVDNLTSGQVVIGGGGAGNLSTTAINGTGNIVATTGASGLVHSGSFSGSFSGDGSGLTGVVANATNALTFGEGIGSTVASYNGSAAVTITVSGAADLSSNAITKWDDAAGKFANSSLTDNGTAITGTTSIQLTGANSNLSGSFSGSFFGNGSGLTGIASTLTIDADSGGPSTVSLTSQTLDIQGTALEIETSVSGQTITIGLPNDVTIGNSLTVTGDLTVNGTTTVINTTNLAVEDQFILLASGSTSTVDAGIIVQNAANAGEALYWENNPSGTGRWAIASNVSPTATTVTAAEFMVTAVTTAGAPSAAPTYGSTNTGYGNIYVNSSNGDIYIYS